MSFFEAFLDELKKLSTLEKQRLTRRLPPRIENDPQIPKSEPVVSPM